MSVETVAGRKRIPADGNIHWFKYGAACSVGYRRITDTDGAWWARYREPGSGRLFYEKLGDYSSVSPAKRYGAATKDAAKWFRTRELGITHDRAIQTVADACRAYVATARNDGRERKASDADSRFARYVYSDPIGKIRLSALRPAHVKAWREQMTATPALVSRNPKKRKTRPRSPATINRDMSSLRAALNAVLEDGLVETDLAWRKHLKAIPESGKARDIYLTREDRLALLAASCAEIQPFLRGLMQLPLRPGALAALTAGSLDKRSGVLTVGKDKSGRDRKFQLPAETLNFFLEQTKGKLPAAPLFARANGAHWDKDSWKGPVKDAVHSAEIRTDATAYALRHSTITDMCASKGNLLRVAQISGTSVAMIEKHYGHLLNDDAAAALAILEI